MRIKITAIVLSVSVATGSIVAVVAASPEPTPAEKLYEKVKEAEKQADRQLAERWHGLVRQRQWTDATGKHRTFARYVDHDPNLQWVKLSIAVKKGEQISYKEATIPLKRLGKNEQALVKRISLVRPQIEEAAAGAPDALPDGGEAALAEADHLPPEMRAAMELTATSAPPESAASTPPLMANEPWRTDFSAFAANLTPPAGENPAPGWGELHALEAVYQKEQMLGMLKQIPAAKRPPKAIMFQQGFAYGWARAALGEVRWQATISAASQDAAAGGTLQHDLQAPSPWQVSLIPDPDYSGDAARFATGRPVEFVGRFAELGGAGGAPHIKLYVRLPSDERAE
jgi:hypothetical protein